MVPEGMIDIPGVINLALASFQFSFVMARLSTVDTKCVLYQLVLHKLL